MFIYHEESNWIVWYDEIVRLRCTQGAPLPKEDASSAEIQELDKLETAGPAVEDSKQ